MGPERMVIDFVSGQAFTNMDCPQETMSNLSHLGPELRCRKFSSVFIDSSVSKHLCKEGVRGFRFLLTYVMILGFIVHKLFQYREKEIQNAA